MGAVHTGVPLLLSGMLKDDLGLTAAVETGTYQGASARALHEIFGRVWSIELSQALFEAARARYGGAGLEFVHGSSPQLLPELLRTIDGPCLFWLDGHWSGGVTAGEDDECPLLGELAAIDQWPSAGRSAILIDDARLFLVPPPPPHDPATWPTFLEVLDTLRDRSDRYVTVLDDVIVAGPRAARGTIERYCRRGPPAPEAAGGAPSGLPPSTPVEVGNGPRAAGWARAAWAELPPSETLRRAARHLRATLHR